MAVITAMAAITAMAIITAMVITAIAVIMFAVIAVITAIAVIAVVTAIAVMFAVIAGITAMAVIAVITAIVAVAASVVREAHHLAGEGDGPRVSRCFHMGTSFPKIYYQQHATHHSTRSRAVSSEYVGRRGSLPLFQSVI